MSLENIKNISKGKVSKKETAWQQAAPPENKDTPEATAWVS